MAEANFVITIERKEMVDDLNRYRNDLKGFQLENLKLRFQRDLMILLFGIAVVVIAAII